MNPEFKTYLLKSTGSKDCKQVETIQSLWSGYGKIARYKLQGGNRETVVVKHIALDKANSHPRGWNTNISHQRKIRSYEVETYWYQHWNGQCGNAARTAEFLGALSIGEEQWIILEDLDLAFPERKREVTQSEIKTCLSWLAISTPLF
jgi:hypothetical protein